MSTITTINSSDTLAASRSTINTNFSALNTDKLEITDLNALIKRIYKSADETVNSSTTIQSDDHLTFSVAANEVWSFKLVADIDSNVTADFKYRLASPTGCSIRWYDHYNFASNRATGTSSEIDYALGVGNSTLIIEGTIVNGANAGSFTFGWAQRLLTAVDTTVLAGSHIIAHRLA